MIDALGFKGIWGHADEPSTAPLETLKAVSDQLKDVRVLSMHDDGSVPTPNETPSEEPETVGHSPTGDE
jgi:hypothetical protein